MRRVLPLSVLVPLLMSVLLAGCGIGPVHIAPPPAIPMPVPRLMPALTDCTLTPRTAEDVDAALVAATPGQRICLLGDRFAAAELVLNRSGSTAAPIVLESDGSPVSGVEIAADNVVVQGLRVWGPGGISARGQNLVIRNNDVRDAVGGGIRCTACGGAQIDANWVVRAEGAGIAVSGTDSQVRDNDVSRSVRTSAPDAVGIGFAGSGLTLRHNYVHDLGSGSGSGSGSESVAYPAGRAPHMDCFRTETGAGSANSGVLITQNTCANVAGYCMAADGGRGLGGGGLRFAGNFCQTSGPAAVSVLAYPGVVVADNTFSADYRTAVLARQGATNTEITGNTLVGEFAVYDADQSSATGLRHSGNVAR